MTFVYKPNAAGLAKLEHVYDEMLDNVAEDVESDAKRYCPVDTGAMRDGIEAVPAVARRAAVKVSRNVPGDDPKVPFYVEFGTRHMNAQPFMRPALYQKRAVRGR